ncbi:MULTISPECIES: hypothetical protein, partial [Pseudomonas putida group]|uniref:hypothetical protein n=1 Tax=Pseudomonas putida group TaxID=136845 RepID=UPI001E6431DA
VGRDQLNGKLSGQSHDELHHFLGHDPAAGQAGRNRSGDFVATVGRKGCARKIDHSRVVIPA